MKRQLLITLFFICCFKVINAQSGTLDYSFGKKGVVRSDIGANVATSSAGRQVFFQDDGSVFIVLEENYSTLITKKHPDGSPDSTYGHNGYSVSVGIINVHAAQQKDGKIVVAGTQQHEYLEYNYDFALARFNLDGSLDNSFAINGIQITDITYDGDAINSIAIQKDGKIIVGGATGGEYYYNNNIPYFSGYLSVARYNADGNLDNTFGVDGILLTDSYTDNNGYIKLQTDGKLIVSSFGDNGFNLHRFYSNGTLDTTFNTYIKLVNSDGFFFVGKSLVIQVDGKIVSGGFWENSNSFKDFALVRFNKDGTIDNTFNGNGIQNTDFREYDDIINSIAIQNDGKIVAIGYASNGYNNAFAIARYNSNGSLDITFDTDGKKMNYINSNDVYGTSVAVNRKGKLIAAGYEQSPTFTNTAIIAYNNNGSLDNTFNRTGTLIDHLFSGKSSGFSSSAVQNNGKIVTAGYAWNGKNYDFAITRFNLNGTFDSTFSTDGIETTDLGSNEYAHSVVVQRDGKIVVGVSNYLLRYNINGSLDNTFSIDGKQVMDVTISSIKLQKDNKIVVTGGGTLARYNTNGSFDASFNGSGKVSPPMSVNDLALQSDGKIVVVGGLSIARFNPNGKLDSTFGTNGIITKLIDQPDEDDDPYGYYDYNAKSVNIQKDGKIGVVGDYIVSNRDFEDSYAFIDRFDSDGVLDFSSFVPGLYGDSRASSIAFENDGKILVAANLFKEVNTSYRTYKEIATGFDIVRLNKDGTLDSTYHAEKDELNSNVRIKSIKVSDNNLYATGDGNLGYIAKYRLNDNRPPTVKITSPTNNTVYSAPATITLNATATDKDGTISVVKFYNGGTLLSTDSTSPYTYTLNNPAAGNYSLVAKATDNNGGRSSSASVAVVVSAQINKAPVVSITSPAGNTVYNAPANITISATASDSDGTVSRVRFYNGGTLLTTDSTSPYTCTLSNVLAGNYSIVAKATDNKGLTSSSSSVTVAVSVTLNKAPVVSITSPASNAVYAAASTVTINASAADPDANDSITNVKFYSGATLLQTDSIAPYTYALINAATGTYSITAKATDNHGLFSSSASVTFTVSAALNKAPTVSITSPANNATYKAPATITINATASDADGSVSNVQFYSGSTLLKTDSTSPYNYTFNNLAAGTYSITAKATDNLGLFSSSASAAIIVSAVTNKPPIVSITSPDSNSVYTAPATITINALASDEDGTISSVKFYNGTTYLKTVSASPYTYTLPNLAEGNYSFTAKATDNNGTETISAAVTISVKTPNKAPTVRITNPVNNATYTAPATITINALAADADGTISSVKFYNGTTYLKAVSASPYTYTLSNLEAGTYTFTAKATDDLGAQTISAAVKVKVVNASIVAGKHSSENKNTALNDALSVKLSPNPATNIVNIQTDGLQSNKPATLSIISVSGIVLKTMRISNAVTRLDVTTLLSGVYMIKIISGDKVVHKQFVKL